MELLDAYVRKNTDELAKKVAQRPERGLVDAVREAESELQTREATLRTASEAHAKLERDVVASMSFVGNDGERLRNFWLQLSQSAPREVLATVSQHLTGTQAANLQTYYVE